MMGHVISWPVAILVIVLLFFRQIKELLPSLQHARFGNTEFDFGGRVEQLEERADQSQLPPPKEEEPTTSPLMEAEQQIEEARRRLAEAERQLAEGQLQANQQELAEARRRLAEAERDLEEAVEERRRQDMLYSLAIRHPPSAVMQAWLEVEQEALELAERIDLFPASRPRSALNIFRALRSRGVIDPDIAGIVDELRHLRNSAVHERQPNISTEDAIEYIEVAERAAEYLRRLYPIDKDN